MANPIPTLPKAIFNFKTSRYYMIAYIDRNNLVSFRVIRWNGPLSRATDCFRNRRQWFKANRILLAYPIPKSEVSKAVSIYYSGNCVHYFKEIFITATGGHKVDEITAPPDGWKPQLDIDDRRDERW